MKKTLILVCIALLLFVTACGQQGASEQLLEDNYHIGTQGIVINFINNAPPTRMYEGDEIDINIELENRGAYPIDKTLRGKLEISGFDPASIKGTWDGGNTMPVDLEGRNQHNQQGGYAVMSYRDLDGVHVPFDADFYEPTLLVHSCYRYKTIADPVVCIDPDPFELVQENKVCNIGDISMGGGQGAPVAVTRIEEEVGSDQIYFRIYISNVGGGSAMLESSYDNCPFDVDFSDLEKITAKVKLPYDTSPDCTPKGTESDPIWLRNGRGYIFCKFRKPATDSAYTTTLNIELGYTYSQSISKNIRIINLQ